MSFFRSLFGRAKPDEPAPKASRTAEHGGFTIRAEPYQAEGGQWQTAGTVSKEIDGAVKEHRFVRADRFGSLDDAMDFALAKGRQLVDQQGDRMFR